MRIASWSRGGRPHAGTVSANGRVVTPLAADDPQRGALTLVERRGAASQDPPV